MENTDIFSLGELFERVQMEHVFPDGKTFVDCIPRSELQAINNLYNSEKNIPGFDLNVFVRTHFEEPKTRVMNFESLRNRPIVEHIEKLWGELKRQPEDENSSLLQLPFPYIVPGGRFREIFYWDSYFTMLGLQVSGRIDMIGHMVDNFAYLIDTFGYIPNGNRTYFLGRSQPPFFACMVKLLSEEKSPEVLVHYLPQLEKEHAFWMAGSELLSHTRITELRVGLMPNGSILNHYWDEYASPRPESFVEDVGLAEQAATPEALYRNLRAACESGWDFSSRWYKDPSNFSSIHTIDIMPVDLNCLLYDLEMTIFKACQLSGDKSACDKFLTRADNRKAAIEKYCWSDEDATYYDFDYVAGIQKKSLTLASAFPLFFKIASATQAAGVAKCLQKHLLADGGLLTTSSTTGQQWDSPNGWAPLQWIAIKGLLNYGYDALATDIAERWMTINEKVYANTGKMMEKYNVVDTHLTAGGGEYQSQDGFGWTNGVYLKLHAIFKKTSTTVQG